MNKHNKSENKFDSDCYRIKVDTWIFSGDLERTLDNHDVIDSDIDIIYYGQRFLAQLP